MGTLTATVDIWSRDDVVITVDTYELLDQIGPDNDGLTETVNALLTRAARDAGVSEWYYRQDSDEVLRSALASALGIDLAEVTEIYTFTTVNWENHLSEDFGGTVFSTPDMAYLVITSGTAGLMRSYVSVRNVDVRDVEYHISAGASVFTVGCTECDCSVCSLEGDIIWEEWTTEDADGIVNDHLSCPQCGSRAVVDVYAGE